MATKRFDKLTEDEVYGRWMKRIAEVRQELHELFANRRRFRDVTSMFENNPELKQVGGQVYDWLLRMWVNDAAVSVRREVDDDSNTVTLGKLLDEMAQRPTILTRRRYLKDVLHSDQLREFLDDTFHAYGIISPTADPMEDYLDPAYIKADRKALDKGTEPIVEYVNRVIAHRTPDYTTKATYKDLNKAIDSFEQTFQKYFAIIDGRGLGKLEPTVIGDWTVPFQIPWVVPAVGDEP